MSDPTDLDRLINERLEALLPKKLAELREKQTPSPSARVCVEPADDR